MSQQTEILDRTPESGKIALAILDAIIQMSDAAESLGGATSIAGVASLHKLQTSIQKNKARILQSLQKELV